MTEQPHSHEHQHDDVSHVHEHAKTDTRRNEMISRPAARVLGGGSPS